MWFWSPRVQLGSGGPRLRLIGQVASLESRVPFLHFFDGFRTSHEISKVYELSDEDLLALMPEAPILDHRDRALTPDRPVIRGTAQNPDTFFQAREACNSFYLACPEIVARTMDQFAARTGRKYQLFDYVGHPEATRVIVLMGSGAETAHETVDYLCSQGEKVGIIKVRLFNPFSLEHFLEALPSHRGENRRPRPHQRTRYGWRAPLPQPLGRS